MEMLNKATLSYKWICIIFCLLFFVVDKSWAEVYAEPWQPPLINDQINISAGSYRYYPLTLQAGAKLSFRVTVLQGGNRDINAWLLDLENFTRFSNEQTFNYYSNSSGGVRYDGTFEFIAPENNIYHLILENKFSVITDKTVKIYATLVYPGKENQNDIEKRAKGFEEAYLSLKSMLVFSDFDIYLKRCGQVNAFGGPQGITICYELIEEYYKFDPEKVGELVTWVFFHELGHTLLNLWGYPLWDNEDAADEFATVLFLMGDKLESILEMARYFSNNPSKLEAMNKVLVDDRHSLSIQRARNLLAWANGTDELLKRWQKLLVPNTKTEMLKDSLSNPEPYVDIKLVKEELEKREKAVREGVEEQVENPSNYEKKAVGKETSFVIEENKNAYINQNLEISDIKTSKELKLPATQPVWRASGKIKNKGSKTVKKAKITIYYYGAQGKAIYEESYYPIPYGEEKDKVLKPNYIVQFNYTDNNAPSEAVKATVDVTDIEFQD